MAEQQVLQAESIREVERLTKDALANNAKVHDIHGEKYSTQSLNRIPGPQSVPARLDFQSLQAIADFARSKVKEYAEPRGGLFLLIDGPTQVSLYTGIFGDFQQRTLLGRALATTGSFKFDAWYKGDTFTIALLSQFAQSEDREQVFRVTGNVASGATITTDDDGVSQLVTVKQGIERTKVAIGPGRIFHLRPFSTFAEVAQPSRPFILRMQSGNANAVPPEQHSCALVEADGGLWRIEAVKSIKEWLLGELGTEKDCVPVYG